MPQRDLKTAQSRVCWRKHFLRETAAEEKKGQTDGGGPGQLPEGAPWARQGIPPHPTPVCSPYVVVSLL